ncbi:MAG: NHLP family bacteriocin export ABC transporter peptidase/permease/ATPase subunit [Pseudomonadota bacterium]
MAKSRATRRHRTPTILQMEAVECGAACLAMVLGYHGRFVSLEELRLLCGVTRDGSKASNLIKAAESFGMIARGFRKEPAGLRTVPLPAILFWNFNHFVVLEGFSQSQGQAYLNDPALGPRVVDEVEFDESFTGVVLTFQPGPDFKPGGSRYSVIAALRRRFHGLHTAIAYLILVGLALVVPGLIIPIFSSVFVDQFLVGGQTGWLRPLVTGMFLTALLRMALTWLESYYLLRVETHIALSSASRFFWHVLRLPVAFYTQRSPGEISGRVGLNDRVASLLSGDLARAWLSVTTLVFFALLMALYNLPLTLLSIAVLSLNLLALQLMARRSKELSQRLSIDGGKLMAALMNGLQIMETVKASGGEAELFSRWTGYQAKYLLSEQAIAQVALWLGAIPGFLTSLNNLLILGVGGLLVVDGQLSLGQLVAFQSLATSFMGPVNSLVELGYKLQEATGDMKRLDDVMQYPLDPWLARPPLGDAPDGEAVPKLDGLVELHDVEFGYSRTDPPLICEIRLTLRPGERIAVVGPSGCGKSTLSKLVMGLYEPWRGEILFDGQPRAAFGRYVFSNSVAMVDQDIVLFEGSVRDNLTLWDPSIAEADLLRAAKDACIDEVIQARPGGFDAPVEGSGHNFSGGQRQRLEIARALAGNPCVLVLDEATSAIDPATEQAIDANLRRRGCACLVIAHRLSTIRDADEILVMDCGRIVERGTHESLSRIENGFYWTLLSQL